MDTIKSYPGNITRSRAKNLAHGMSLRGFKVFVHDAPAIWRNYVEVPESSLPDARARIIRQNLIEIAKEWGA